MQTLEEFEIACKPFIQYTSLSKTFDMDALFECYLQNKFIETYCNPYYPKVMDLSKKVISLEEINLKEYSTNVIISFLMRVLADTANPLFEFPYENGVGCLHVNTFEDCMKLYSIFNTLNNNKDIPQANYITTLTINKYCKSNGLYNEFELALYYLHLDTFNFIKMYNVLLKNNPQSELVLQITQENIHARYSHVINYWKVKLEELQSYCNRITLEIEQYSVACMQYEKQFEVYLNATKTDTGKTDTIKNEFVIDRYEKYKIVSKDKLKKLNDSKFPILEIIQNLLMWDV